MEQTVLAVAVSDPEADGEHANTSPQYLSILSVSLPWPEHRPCNDQWWWKIIYHGDTDLWYLNVVLEASIERLNRVIGNELAAAIFVMFRHSSVARLSSIISLETETSWRIEKRMIESVVLT